MVKKKYRIAYLNYIGTNSIIFIMDNSINYLITLLFSSFFCYRTYYLHQKAYPYYADHHSTMSKKIVEMSGELLLIDCHSFSSFPNLLNSNPPDIDICIGYNDDETCPSTVVIESIARHFGSIGYKVEINFPFSNSKTFEVPTEYHTVMIEVNKRLYMNEETLDKTDGFMRLKDEIQSLYKILLKG